MKLYHPPSGLSLGLDFIIDAEWTPRQALAVIELLDDLRDRIWTHYQSPLLELLLEDRITRPPPRSQQALDRRTTLLTFSYLPKPRGRHRPLVRPLKHSTFRRHPSPPHSCASSQPATSGAGGSAPADGGGMGTATAGSGGPAFPGTAGDCPEGGGIGSGAVPAGGLPSAGPGQRRLSGLFSAPGGLPQLWFLCAAGSGAVLPGHGDPGGGGRFWRRDLGQP